MRYLIDVHTDERARQQRLEEDVRRGLTSRPKSLPPKYFYDRAGSLLFERITELPEYYPTRTEAALLEEILPGLIEDFLPDDIVEVGAGSSEKTRRVLDAVTAGGRPVRYVPLDVDRVTLEASAERLLGEYPSLRVHAVVGDFERDLTHVPPPAGRRTSSRRGGRSPFRSRASSRGCSSSWAPAGVRAYPWPLPCIHSVSWINPPRRRRSRCGSRRSRGTPVVCT